MLKKILLALAVIFVVIQFIRPEKNVSDERTYDISTKYAVPEDVGEVLRAACNDCHSNKTEYPWYASVQPVAWWLDHHIREGKEELNFSDFVRRPLASQYHKFEEVVELVEEKAMPLPSYTYLGMHPEARLTDAQRALLVNWAKAQMDTLKAHHPADSLVRKKH